MYLRTPMCAAPLAPPPESTRPILGRAFTAVVSLEYAVTVTDKSKIVHRVLNVVFI